MTFRAIVGTIAVLAGFAVVERSVDASTSQAGSCTSAQAYALLQSGESLEVRIRPAPEAPVIGLLPASPITVISSQSGWARIALENDPTRQQGWIPADVMMVDARVDGVITAYSRPGLMGRKLARIESEDTRFRVLGCRGDWMQVISARHGNVWIDRWCAREEGCRS